jgi:hypothetical protein
VNNVVRVKITRSFKMSDVDCFLYMKNVLGWSTIYFFLIQCNCGNYLFCILFVFLLVVNFMFL